MFVGGGGFTLPRFVAAARPDARSRVLEVDGELVDLARERSGLSAADERSMRVRVGDARLTLRDEPSSSADLVVGDAFGGRAVPWHLTTREFLRRRAPRAAPARRLRDERDRPGAAQVRAGADRDADRRLRRRRRDRPRRSRASEPGGGNVLLLAGESRVPDAVVPRGRDITALRGDRARDFAGDADVLRDDYAPADQLLSPRD